MNKIVRVRYDEGESDLHMHAKDKICEYLIKHSITLTNHLKEIKVIDPNDINEIKQEFSWYKSARGKPRKSFSADVAVLDSNKEIIAVVEIVKTSGITEKKYNFYETLGIFWLEVAAEHVLSENQNFLSSFTYKFQEIKTNINSFLTEYQIPEIQIYQNEKALIHNKIYKINQTIKLLKIKKKKNKKEIRRLQNQRKKLVSNILTISEERIILKKKKSKDKIKQFRLRIIKLKQERKLLKDHHQNYNHINEELKKLRKVIENIKIENLSNRQKKLRNIQINEAKHEKKKRKKVFKAKNKLVIDIFNFLEKFNKINKTDNIDFNNVYQQFYTNKKFSRFGQNHLKQLEYLGWTFSKKNQQFQRISS